MLDYEIYQYKEGEYMQEKRIKIVLDTSNVDRYGEVTISDIKDYMFENEYQKLTEIFNELLKKEKKKEINNVIAIIGDRGAGKSSFLKTFLKGQEIVKNEEGKVKVLEIIDPSKFTKGTEVLELIIGYIFKEFKETLEKYSTEIDFDEKRKILEKFQNVQKGIRYIKGEKDETGNSLEELLKISETINLDKNICELVEKYLLFIKRDKLVIPIDDLDLNTIHVYQTIEYLRKYLMNSEIIILIAVKYDQLEGAIKDCFYKEYEKIEKFYEKEDIKKEVEDRTYKYLLKFSPYDRRIYLPTPFKNNIKEAYVKEDNKKIELIIAGDKTGQKIENYINEKIGYLCIEDERHQLIPNNLRELIFFVLNIKRIAENKDGTYQKADEFKRFFLEYWVSEKLNYIESNILKNWDKEETLIGKNRVIYSYLKSQLFKLKENIDEYEFKKIEENLLTDWSNIRIGDIRYLAGILKDKNQDLKFLYAVDMLYNYILNGSLMSDDEKGKRFFKRPLDTLEHKDYDVTVYTYSILKESLEEAKKNVNAEKIKNRIEKIVCLDDSYNNKERSLNSLNKVSENIYERVALSRICQDQTDSKKTIIDIIEDWEEKLEKERELSKKIELLLGNKEEDSKVEKVIKKNELKKFFQVIRETFNKNNGKKLDTEEKFDKFREGLIEKIIDKNKITVNDLINNILYSLKTERSDEKYESPLEYFLKGEYNSNLETLKLGDNRKDDVFFGVIGEFYKRAILEEKGVEPEKALKEEEIIDRFYGKGDLVELFHLNLLKLNEGYDKNEALKLEEFITKNLDYYTGKTKSLEESKA